MNRRLSIVLLVVLLITLPSCVQSQSDFKKVGSAGYVFLTIPVGARTAGLGEASIALSDLGPEGLFVNPGTVAHLRGSHGLLISFAPWLAETRHEAIGYVMNLDDWGVVGIGIDRLDMGSIPGYRNPRAEIPGEYEATGTYTADGIGAGVTYGRRLTEKFSFGITTKFVQERIDRFTSSNVVFDAGLLYFTGFRSLRVGGAVRNFGVESKYLQGLFKMPADFRFGLAAEVWGSTAEASRLTLAVEALHPTDNVERMNVGGEFWYDNLFALRGGYKFFADEESWSAGISLRWARGTVEYAYAAIGRLANVSRVTVQMEFE